MSNPRWDPGGASAEGWTVDLLADLHAGVLDDEEAARVWQQVRDDPEAMAVLRGLDATVADLASLAGAEGQGSEPAPADVAARIDSALERERGEDDSGTGPPAPVTDIATARARGARRFPRWGWTAGVAAAAAVAMMVALAAVIVPDRTTGGTPLATDQLDGAELPPVTLQTQRPELALDDTFGIWDYGPLDDRATLDECLEANDIDPDVRPAGVREATVDGEPAVLVVLTTGEFAQYRLLALPPGCGPDSPGVLYDEVVGGTR
ncbi:hypothetical protein [Haloechinothrix sp. LS1_15]|uniref:hypothetical protein n=1 Tax=Haloechinothrix sp. LS1_15 TaxID=2652248 RepID=UPI002944E394|nr:hypothetical protein [Haloechinothrix sp. LS1_15]MDV6010988.1 hypothetical protein [Haloechinothrix sp. LS1_15]